MQKPASKLILLPLLLVVAFLSSCQPQPEEQAPQEDDIILSLNAYSFSDLMLAKDRRNNQQMYSLFHLLDWCATQDIKALDPTAYFFPTYPEVPSDEYLAKFKHYADSLGIAISGTGVRNNFASPDSTIRAEGVELAKAWIVAASKIGAPVLRVFAGAIPKGYEDNWEVPAQWMIDCYKELLPLAEQYNVKIGIQNHGEMLQTAEECLYVLNAIDSEWAGIIVDTGNFKTKDPYKDIAQIAPYAVNWQVKDYPYGRESKKRTDFVKLVKIIRESGYKGYLPVETLLVQGEPYDPFVMVPDMIGELKKALEVGM